MVWWMYRHQCPVMWLDHQPTNHLREQCSGYFALSLALHRHRHRHRRGSASWQPYSYSASSRAAAASASPKGRVVVLCGGMEFLVSSAREARPPPSGPGPCNSAAEQALKLLPAAGGPPTQAG